MGFITPLRVQMFAFLFSLGMIKGLQNCELWVGKIHAPAPTELGGVRSSVRGSPLLGRPSLARFGDRPVLPGQFCFQSWKFNSMK